MSIRKLFLRNCWTVNSKTFQIEVFYFPNCWVASDYFIPISKAAISSSFVTFPEVAVEARRHKRPKNLLREKYFTTSHYRPNSMRKKWTAHLNPHFRGSLSYIANCLLKNAIETFLCPTTMVLTKNSKMTFWWGSLLKMKNGTFKNMAPWTTELIRNLLTLVVLNCIVILIKSFFAF